MFERKESFSDEPAIPVDHVGGALKNDIYDNDEEEKESPRLRSPSLKDEGVEPFDFINRQKVDKATQELHAVVDMKEHGEQSQPIQAEIGLMMNVENEDFGNQKDKEEQKHAFV